MTKSEKSETNWEEFAKLLAPVETISERVLVRKRSRDFFWYSPILNDALKHCFGDLVALPKTVEELKHCLASAFKAQIPVVLRGGGTGNYGQAVPVDGGLIIETTQMNRILEIGDGFVRVEAGAIMADINAALNETGQELAMFPSTHEIATIGGFVAGGSVGIGSLATGALREPGNLMALNALSVEQSPQLKAFAGPDVLKIHHAWGLNGVITDVTLRTVPTQDWIGCIASFADYGRAYGAGYQLATDPMVSPKLLSIVDARIAAYFPRLKTHVKPDQHLLVSYVPAGDVAHFTSRIKAAGGAVELALNEEDRRKASLPHAFEFTFNHTTLQVLKSDRSATYQQIGVPDVTDVKRIEKLRVALGEEAWTHHEFYRLGGNVVSIDLPIIWFKNAAQLERINQTYRDHGFAVYDAHEYHVERGGLHNADYSHLAWKKRMDPSGLLNSAKSMAWNAVKHLSPEEIEAKRVLPDTTN